MSEQDQARGSWLSQIPVQVKLMMAFGLPLLVVALNTLVFFEVQQRQKDAREWTIHTYEVLNGLEDLVVQMLNQQTGLRGYRLSGEDRFLATFRAGKADAETRLQALRQLVSDNPAQQARLQRAEQILERWQATVAQPLIKLPVTAETAAEARELVARGKDIFEELRRAQYELETAERALLETRTATLVRSEQQARVITYLLLLVSVALVVTSLWLARRQITLPLVRLTGLMARLAEGDDSIAVPDTHRADEIGAVARALARFKQMTLDIRLRNWVKTHAGEIAQALQAQENRRAFAATLSSRLAPLIDAGVVTVHLLDEHSELLELFGSYGYRAELGDAARYRVGEGLTGQCAKERRAITLDAVPADYPRVQSGTGAALPRTVLLRPLMSRDVLLGVIEFGTFGKPGAQQLALLDELLPLAALSLENLQRALRTRELLEESQMLTQELQASSEELRVQQEELRTTNETLYAKQQQLEEQAARLQASEEELKVQSDQLQVTNEELRERGETLSQQKATLESLQAETQQKADELARASQYKSEFLANMSHELRTPLNSLLILSRGLADNEEGHLSEDEVESARVIHESGSNLLRLINDILDLSKVEAGKMELSIEPVSLPAFGTTLTRNFRHVARERGLGFNVELAPDLPDHVETDPGKLEQIVNNLLSNAFKFTRQGAVTVRIERSPAVAGTAGSIAIKVSDTGVGIPTHKHEKVFQAFEQADGSTSRQFGGTGLGLSIARSMAQLMGGEITLESVEGQGTTFTLLLPLRPDAPVPRRGATSIAAPPPAEHPAPPAPPPSAPAPARKPTPPAMTLADDRELLKAGETVILIVEDDLAFARILIERVRKQGHRALFAGDGETGLALAREHRPTGILLDVMLPGMDGFSVLESLKAEPGTRHIPVHFISATDEHGKGLDLGAVGFLTKPVTREGLTAAFEKLLHFAEGRTRRVLVVDDDAGSRLAVRKLISGDQIEVSEAASGEDALKAVQESRFDCVILDLGMAGMDGFQFLEHAAQIPAMPPVVIYSGRELSAEETLKLRAHTDSIVIKGARSPERLLDEVSLFLHSIREAPARSPRKADQALSGRTVLLVDDDMRNIFALSKALKAKGLTVVMAQDGMKAIQQLEENRSIELVLMDIMMPGMDGYQTMAEIRRNPRHQSLPILALTAKAMRGDREKCLEAGANDYLSKPIDLDRLFSMMQVWLPAR